MHILNINDSLEVIRKTANICLVITLILVCGCSREAVVSKAQEYSQQSQQYYKQAVAEYQRLLGESKDLDRLHYELGKLYFDHGDFKEAAEEFKKSSSSLAKKFLAIAYYRLANFTDALEIFNKEKISDDEYIYYKGLTSEKLNLFDQAVQAYHSIKAKDFVGEAKERIERIERKLTSHNIKDIDPEVAKIIASAPEAASYPQAGALILNCDESVDVRPDGTKISDLHYVVKVLNERGKEGFSETHLEYDSTFEKIELIYARTIKPDGTVVDVGSRHIRDVSKYLNFPLYSNARVYIISFPEIAEGAVIEYKVKIYDNQLINKKDFVSNYPVQSQEPILKARFAISVPKDKPLYIKQVNERYNDFDAKLSPAKEELSDKTLYTWEFKNIPQIIPESNMPPQVEINPTIRLSTFANWQEIYNWWWGLAKDKIQADPAIKSKVAELIRGKSIPEEKIRAIYNFCVKDVRYVAIEYGQAGYEPHKAEDTFKNKYGDCKDKAILLITMLKEAGISAWPVLISTDEYYDLDEGLPSMSFNHTIAALSLDGKTVFMDGTAETCMFGDLPTGDQDRRVLVFKEDGFTIEKTPLFPSANNLVKQELRIDIKADETISGSKTITTLGFYDQAQRYWLLYTQPELIKETLKEKIQDISIGATLDSYIVKNADNLNVPVLLEYQFHGPEYFTHAGALRIMPQLASVDTALVAKEKRKFPLEFSGLETKETDFQFRIPQGLKIAYLPSSVTEDSPWMEFRAEFMRQDSVIYFKQKMTLKKNVVSAEEYADFKKFFENVAKKVKQRIVLEKAH